MTKEEQLLKLAKIQSRDYSGLELNWTPVLIIILVIILVVIGVYLPDILGEI